MFGAQFAARTHECNKVVFRHREILYAARLVRPFTFGAMTRPACQRLVSPQATFDLFWIQRYCTHSSVINRFIGWAGFFASLFKYRRLGRLNKCEGWKRRMGWRRIRGFRCGLAAGASTGGRRNRNYRQPQNQADARSCYHSSLRLVATRRVQGFLQAIPHEGKAQHRQRHQQRRKKCQVIVDNNCGRLHASANHFTPTCGRFRNANA